MGVGGGSAVQSHSMGGVRGGERRDTHRNTQERPKPKLLSPDIFWWGGGLPREGVGAKKFGMSLETQGIKLFWRDIPGFCRDILEAPEKFEKKKFGFNSRPLIKMKLALPPPPFQKTPTPSPKTRNFMGMGAFQQKERRNSRRP